MDKDDLQKRQMHNSGALSGLGAQRPNSYFGLAGGDLSTVNFDVERRRTFHPRSLYKKFLIAALVDAGNAVMPA